MLNEISNNLESSIWTLEDFGKEGAGADEAPANEGETEVKDLGKANEKKEKKEKKQAEEPMKEAVWKDSFFCGSRQKLRNYANYAFPAYIK